MLQSITRMIDRIKVNKQNGQFAVYKPLLLLIIFDAVRQKHPNSFRYSDFRDRLESLMEKYGWSTFSRKKAAYPFFFLASSELWNINLSSSDLLHPDAPSDAEMSQVTGKLDQDIYDYLIVNPSALDQLIDFIKDKWSLSHVNEVNGST